MLIRVKLVVFLQILKKKLNALYSLRFAVKGYIELIEIPCIKTWYV